MISIEKEIQKSKNRISELEHQKRIERKIENTKKIKLSHRRNYIIGELVTRYFPEVLNLEPGNKDQNAVIFKPVEAFLSALTADRNLVNQIKNAATNNNATITETTDYPTSKCSDV